MKCIIDRKRGWCWWRCKIRDEGRCYSLEGTKQMLSLVMLKRDMNRSEQENLYRTSRKLSLVPIAGNHSHGNIFDSDKRRSSHAKIFDDNTMCRDASSTTNTAATTTYPEDLVLSVLKSPVNHVGVEQKDINYGISPGSDVALCSDTPEDDSR